MTDPLKNLLDSPNFSLDLAMEFIKYGCDPNTLSSRGNSLLHLLILEYQKTGSSQEGIIASLKKLIKDYKANIHIENSGGFTPLELYLRQDKLDHHLINQLLDLGADPNSTDDSGDPIVHIYITKQLNLSTDLQFQFLPYLIRNKLADINVKNKEGRTVFERYLDLAGHLDQLTPSELVKRGADPESKDTKGNGLLHQWVHLLKYKQDTHIFELVSRGQFNINSLNADGQTPLQVLMEGHQFGVKFKTICRLVNLGANPKVRKKNGDTLIHYYMNMDRQPRDDKHYEQITRLIRTFDLDVNAVNTQNKTPLQCLMDKPNSFAISDLLFLAKMGANLDVINSEGESVLEVLVISPVSNVSTLQTLIDFKQLNLEITNTIHMSVFDIAMQDYVVQKVNTANLNLLIDYSLSFKERVKKWIREDNLAQLNQFVMNVYNRADPEAYEFLGKIRKLSYGILKDSLNDLSLDQKLEKLQWARKQSLFAQHRSYSFFGKLGRTDAVCRIDQCLDQLVSQPTCVSPAA